MSLVSARGGPLKPEIRLAKAISEFEGMLSLEQKVDFQKHTQLPDASDVMRLTAEIDQTSIAKANERRRCYGPRVTNFLEGLHQFASTVDIAVGGAIQNRTASGVWAVVRFALLASTKYSPYIDKLSTTFMEISRATPAFKEMTKLYSGSQRLQDALSEYYIIVVELCREIYTISQTSIIAQLWTAFADESYKQRLKQWSHAIQIEISLETTKLIKTESKQSQAFRFTSKKHMELQHRQKQQEVNQRILNSCSTHNFQTIWKQTRKAGNTTSFLADAAYQEWLSTKAPCTLLYSGKLGSGKSVLLANIVNDLYLRDEYVNKTAYFFCRYDVTDSLNARTVVGCLTRQLLEDAIDLEILVEKAGIDANSSEFDMDDLLKLVKLVVTKPLHFVLDGIDDLNQAQRQRLLDSIYDLQKQIPLLICLGTHSPHDLYRGTRFTGRMLYAKIPPHNADIDLYINTEIDQRIANGSLVISDDDLVEEVKKKLSTKARGMFLWVHLQIVNICTMVSDFEIRQALSDLPDDLAATYSRLLRNLSFAKPIHQSRLLELLLVAYRPLHYDELREALSFELGETEFDPSKILNNIEGILRSCNGLVLVDEEELTVRLAHFSANQFLRSSEYEHRFDETIAQQKMFGIAMTYLNSAMLETQMTRHKPQALNVAVVPAALLMMTVPKLSRFIPRRPNIHLDPAMVGVDNASIASTPRFKVYALECWHEHFMAVDQTDTNLDLFDAVVMKGRIDLADKDKQRTLVDGAVALRHENSLTRLLGHDAIRKIWSSAKRRAENLQDLESIDILVRCHPDHITLMRSCLIDEDIFVLESLLRVCSSDFFNQAYKVLQGGTPLTFAIKLRDYATFYTLFESHKVDVSRTLSITGHDTFFWAVTTGSRLILEAITNEMPSEENYSSSELWELLIERPYDPRKDSWGLYNKTYLSGGEGGIVFFLLERGYINVHESVGFEYTQEPSDLRILPLAKAAFTRRTGIVDAILRFDPSARSQLCHYRIGKEGKLEGPIDKKTAVDFARNWTIRASLKASLFQ